MHPYKLSAQERAIKKGFKSKKKKAAEAAFSV
jgi:hypothetical protein